MFDIFNFALSFFHLGLILVIQVIHYPLFKYSSNNFKEFHKAHTKRISIIVIPSMLIEFILTSYLMYLSFPDYLRITNFIVVVLIWLCTLLISSPIHILLSKKYQENLINKLVLTNIPRVVLWTIKCIVSFLIIS